MEPCRTGFMTAGPEDKETSSISFSNASHSPSLMLLQREHEEIEGSVQNNRAIMKMENSHLYIITSLLSLHLCRLFTLGFDALLFLSFN